MGRGDGDGGRETLVRICDLAGRTRGTGFVADDRGTVVTSHEVVDGLTRVVLHAPGERTCLAEADAVTPLPEADLALVRTEGLGVRPLPVAARESVAAGTYVRIAAHGWREARVLGESPVTYTATDRFHLLGSALELAIGTEGADALRLGGEAAGGPVLDAATGAVLGVLGTALHAAHRAAGLAVPLRPDGGPLEELLRRNAATVPGYGEDLNLAGALQLTATSVGSAGGPGVRRDPVERRLTVRHFTDFAAGSACVLGLVGDPGTGRTTELAALAARRARGPEPAPTVWLRGADLRAGDGSVADAVARALRQAGRIVAAAGAPGDMECATPERVARLASDAGRPLLVLLDGPEEMPPVLAHRLPEWTAGTAAWLREAGARLVVACRPEHWEQAGALFPPDALHPAEASRLPHAVRIGDLSRKEAARARERYGIPDNALADRAGRHPLTLRLLAEVRDALPGEVPGRPGREDVFAAHLDLMCLRIAVRLAAARRPAPHGTAVRRLAARVAGRVHEAARRCLGPGQGELDRENFEEIFPWRTGWASAVLTEGLLVPAGSGYRFAHEELADWLQAAHLDLDAALHALVHRWCEDAPGTADRAPARLPSRPGTGGPGGRSEDGAAYVPPPPGSRAAATAGEGEEPAGPPHPGVPDQRRSPRREDGRRGRRFRPGPVPPAPEAEPAPPEEEPRTLPVPRHRIGPVLQALLLLDREHGADRLAPRLVKLVEALDRPAAGPGAGEQDRTEDACWWAVHLLGQTLLRVPEPRTYLCVLRLLADRISERSVRAGGPGRLGGLGEFGPWFWQRLRIGDDRRMELMRRLVPADGAPGAAPEWARYLDAVDRRLAAEPRSVQPLLCRWFTDERPLPAPPGSEMRPTVAGAAQALLYARRSLAIDDLTEALVATAHARADELLAALAEDEPSALCRAVDRWAHDDRPERRVAAAAYGPRVAPYVTTGADRDLLRYAALALLARSADTPLHGAALGLLIRDPRTRARYLDKTLARYTGGDPRLPAAALTAALTTHPEPVLAAFQTRLDQPGDAAAEVLRALAEINTPALARRAAALVRAYLDRHPEGAAHAAAFVERRLEYGPAARAVLFPLVTSVLRGCSPQVRRALAPVLAAPGSRTSRPLRAELLDVLLEYERYESRDPAVLHALLRAAALGAEARPEARTRDLVHRTGLLLVRTPEGASCFDRRVVELAREVPEFAVQVAGWLVQAPHEWSAVIGPSARRTVETLAVPMPMRAEPAGHGSLRPV
ncbi:serine protease [Streptomyces sp. BPTC-684]|uniref:S1 family peptidase n=1 Tax=Streptomyces sp. BPTC-684 TaxID=3043734 RepID=UPI0024B22269|nr:serine protease [Streptomyces sp. BPTC-684]WHM36217.1 serine protease [Streptomyces sp. BPTC-684]